MRGAHGLGSVRPFDDAKAGGTHKWSGAGRSPMGTRRPFSLPRPRGRIILLLVLPLAVTVR